MRKIPESRTIKNPLRPLASRLLVGTWPLAPPDVDSTDPFAVLGSLEPAAALNKKGNQTSLHASPALKFPSDVINKDSPKEERPRRPVRQISEPTKKH
jgi:hypothetical protein